MAWLFHRLGPRRAKAKLKAIILYFEAATAFAVSAKQVT
jgi:hypothetical protein